MKVCILNQSAGDQLHTLQKGAWENSTPGKLIRPRENTDTDIWKSPNNLSLCVWPSWCWIAAPVTRFLSYAMRKNSWTQQTTSRKAQVLLKQKYTLKKKIPAALRKNLPWAFWIMGFCFLRSEGCPKAIHPASWPWLVSHATWRGGGSPGPSILYPGLDLFLMLESQVWNQNWEKAE